MSGVLACGERQSRSIQCFSRKIRIRWISVQRRFAALKISARICARHRPGIRNDNIDRESEPENKRLTRTGYSMRRDRAAHSARAVEVPDELQSQML
jgi:hypothetical protein